MRYVRSRARCPVCGKEVGVNNSKIMYHKWFVRGRSVPCSGVGRDATPKAAAAEA